MMKITDKTEVKVDDPVVARGDIIKRRYGFSYEYYIVAKSKGDASLVIINLDSGNNYTSNHIPKYRTLSYFADHIFVGSGRSDLTLIPADSVELVIGG